jgi:excisionase family DNA binding protein
MARPAAPQFESMPLLTVKQVCERTQLSPSTIRRALKANDLPHNAIGRSIRVSEADLQRFLSRNHSNLGK